VGGGASVGAPNSRTMMEEFPTKKKKNQQTSRSSFPLIDYDLTIGVSADGRDDI
jgi:hypothetical protein